MTKPAYYRKPNSDSKPLPKHKDGGVNTLVTVVDYIKKQGIHTLVTDLASELGFKVDFTIPYNHANRKSSLGAWVGDTLIFNFYATALNVSTLDVMEQEMKNLRQEIVDAGGTGGDLITAIITNFFFNVATHALDGKVLRHDSSYNERRTLEAINKKIIKRLNTYAVPMDVSLLPHRRGVYEIRSVTRLKEWASEKLSDSCLKAQGELNLATDSAFTIRQFEEGHIGEYKIPTVNVRMTRQTVPTDSDVFKKLGYTITTPSLKNLVISSYFCANTHRIGTSIALKDGNFQEVFKRGKHTLPEDMPILHFHNLKSAGAQSDANKSEAELDEELMDEIDELIGVI